MSKKFTFKIGQCCSFAVDNASVPLMSFHHRHIGRTVVIPSERVDNKLMRADDDTQMEKRCPVDKEQLDAEISQCMEWRRSLEGQHHDENRRKRGYC